MLGLIEGVDSIKYPDAMQDYRMEIVEIQNVL